MNLSELEPLVAGAITMGYFIAGLLFLRFWSRTQDQLFLIFATAFGLLGAHRLLLVLDARSAEDQVPYFLMRLVAYILILMALYLKNRKTSPGH
jgi:hypothetical protein